MHSYKTDQINAVGQAQNQQNLFPTDYDCDGVRMFNIIYGVIKGKPSGDVLIC